MTSLQYVGTYWASSGDFPDKVLFAYESIFVNVGDFHWEGVKTKEELLEHPEILRLQRLNLLKLIEKIEAQSNAGL
jgi:hypothetical protein